MQEASDEQLAARFCAGEQEAFGQVYAQYEQAVFRYAYHLLGHREDADDVKQETFLRAYQAMKTFRRDSSLRTWLFAICGNLCRDKIKSWERRKIHCDAGIKGEFTPGSDENDPVAIVERAETHSLILKALHGMPAAQREVVILHEVEGLDYKEIAQILGCTHASVKLRVFRARRDLKARVASLMQVR